MNIAAYIIYLVITYFITIHVGFIFYNKGRIYILRLFNDDKKIAGFVNRILLTGYYLLNLGYAALMIRTWKTITTCTEIITTVTHRVGTIMLSLAIIHFLNMGVILLISQRHHHFINDKT